MAAACACCCRPARGLAELVESGALSGARAEALVESFVRPLLNEGADTLVLGCTHYPFLRPVIERVVGPGVDLIDPASAVARELARRLAPAASDTPAPPATPATPGDARSGSECFWTSGALAQANTVMPVLWGRAVQVLALPALTEPDTSL